jgi:hypothetical protein
MNYEHHGSRCNATAAIEAFSMRQHSASENVEDEATVSMSSVVKINNVHGLERIQDPALKKVNDKLKVVFDNQSLHSPIFK